MPELSSHTAAKLTDLVTMLKETPSLRSHYLVAARQIREDVDRSRIMDSGYCLSKCIWILESMQYYATYDADTGGIVELASWCERGWHKVLQRDSNSVAAFSGRLLLCHTELL